MCLDSRLEILFLKTGMLGYPPAHAVNSAALRIGVENHVSALRANQIKGCFVALKDIGFSLHLIFGHHSAVSIKALVASEPVSRRHVPGGFQGNAYGIQPVHVAIVNKIRHLRQSTSADTQA
ncbi:hypothetical protein RMS29_016255 [Agrobacterium rosae]|uniref:Uncharacterized protein n=2 Tax=Agrobacterium rosae TaxID=1972867 RepID=A0ABU4W3E2_9HYPH|nr:hypothetical protein [Agrobacterium rosae]MDX8332302.1 hypothetical protein [Agrobacterium rosae]